MERQLLFPLAALLLGIAAAHQPGISIPAVSAIPASLVALWGFYRKCTTLLVAGASLLAFVWGFISISQLIHPSLPCNHIARLAVTEKVIVTGIVDSRPTSTEKGARFTVRVERVYDGNRLVDATGRLMVYVGDGHLSLLTGDRVSVTTRLREPRNFGLPGEFDFRHKLALSTIYVTGFIANSDGVKVIKRQAADRLQWSIDSAAAWFGRFIDTSVANPESGVLRALLIGDRGAVPRQVEDLYTRTGVNHILSISGFHVGVIAFVLYQVLGWLVRRSDLLLRYNSRRWLLFAILPVLVSYLLLSGAAPATTRSVVTIAACMFALIVERDVEPLHMLALVALAILLPWPQALFDLSFQLSFLAIWGILVLEPLFMKPFSSLHGRKIYRFLQFIAVSMAAIAATLLPVAHHFHRGSFTGLLSNFIVIPLLGYGAVVLGFTGLLAAPVLPPVAKIFLLASSWLVRLSDLTLGWLDRIPQLPRFTPSSVDVLLSVLLLFALSIFRSTRSRLVAAVVITAFFALHHMPAGEAANDLLRITFFSVGQGESTLIRFPDGSTMLVDGGGALREGGMEVGERLLAPALWTMGVHKIDIMVLSHPHPDHLRGLRYIAANFPVGEFWESGYSCMAPEYRELKQILALRKVPVINLDAGSPPFLARGARVELLSPLRARSTHGGTFQLAGDQNEESLVFRLTIGKFSMLFTGDSGFENEAQLLRHPEKLACSVLKVAHHGSRHSSSIPFLKAASPRIALIAAGYGNSFHLPSDDTLDDLRQIGAAVYRTDIDGTVALTINPSSGMVAVRKITGSGN